MSKTVGFPMIRNYSGDPRDFIPDLFAFMDRYEGVEFYLEKGYGSRLGYSEDDYYKASGKVHFVSREEAFGQDITMILKNPDLNDLEMLQYAAHSVCMEQGSELCRRQAEFVTTGVEQEGIRKALAHYGLFGK